MQRTILRKAVAVACTGTLLLATVSACSSSKKSASSSSSTASLTEVTVMSLPGQITVVPVAIATQEGFFAKHGVEVKVVTQPGNLSGSQALKATGANAGAATVSNLVQGWQGGAKVAYFCGLISALQISIIASASSTLPSTESGASYQDVLKSLSGKTIGSPTAIGSGIQTVLAAALKDAGATDVKFVFLGLSAPTIQAALERGTVDAAQVLPTVPDILVTQKVAKQLIYMANSVPVIKNNYGTGWVADPSWVEDNPTAAKGFCDGITEAIAFMKNSANSQAVDKAIVSGTGVSADLAEYVRQHDLAQFSSDLPDDVLTQTFAQYIQLGILKDTPAPTLDALVKKPGK